MLRRTTSTFAIPVLMLLGFAAGCKSAKQPPPVTTAGMRVEVVKLSYSKKQHRVDVRVKLWNDHDQRIAFDLGSVRLLCGDREVSAKPYKNSDPSPDVQAKSNREFNWYFEAGEELSGNYKVEIRDIQSAGLPLGDTALFTINIGK